MNIEDLFEAKRSYADTEFRLSWGKTKNVFNSIEAQQAFIALGDGQRGTPEHIMRNIQRMFRGSGVLFLIEHIGDLTHRLSDPSGVRSGNWSPDYAVPKITEMFTALKRNNYTRETFFDDITRNGADAKGVEMEMLRYSEAHKKLRVYNAAQYHAREAAVELGLLNFDNVQRHLDILNRMVRAGSFVEIAAGYNPQKYR